MRIFGLAFLTYNLDHQNAGAAVAEWMARVAGRGHRTDYRLTFAVAALFTLRPH